MTKRNESDLARLWADCRTEVIVFGVATLAASLTVAGGIVLIAMLVIGGAR